MQNEYFLRSTILLSVAFLALPYLSTLSHKRNDFRKNVIEHEMCALIFSTAFVRTFLILRINERDDMANVDATSCKVPVFLSDF